MCIRDSLEDFDSQAFVDAILTFDEAAAPGQG